MTIKDLLGSCWTLHRGKTIGFSCGLIFGILVLSLGFWRAVFLGFCVAVGCWIGSFYDKRESFIAFLDKILPNILNK
jgi:uncharacterized membrane protein